MGNPWEVAFVIGVLAFWVLFPMGIFISVGKLDKNTNQLEVLARRHRFTTRQTAREVPREGIHFPHLANPFRKYVKH